MKRRKPKRFSPPKPLDAMHAIGVAVFCAQIFETVFVLVARTALKHPEATQMDDIAPFSAKAYKQPIAALVRELTQDSQIDEGLATRIGNLIEDRNLLVHRFFLVRAAPVSVDNIFDDALIHLSRRVYSESGALAGELLLLFSDYARRFPEIEKSLVEMRKTVEHFSRHMNRARARVFA